MYNTFICHWNISYTQEMAELTEMGFQIAVFAIKIKYGFLPPILELQHQYADAIPAKPQSHYILSGISPVWAWEWVLDYIHLCFNICSELKVN